MFQHEYTHMHTCMYMHTHTHTHVVSEPVITNVTDTDVVTFVGDTVQLKCTAAGSPAPSYRWLKDQAAITDGEYNSRPFTYLSRHARLVENQSSLRHASCTISITRGRQGEEGEGMGNDWKGRRRRGRKGEGSGEEGEWHITQQAGWCCVSCTSLMALF